MTFVEVGKNRRACPPKTIVLDLRIDASHFDAATPTPRSTGIAPTI